jgi:hypothetical protein
MPLQVYHPATAFCTIPTSAEILFYMSRFCAFSFNDLERMWIFTPDKKISGT